MPPEERVDLLLRLQSGLQVMQEALGGAEL